MHASTIRGGRIASEAASHGHNLELEVLVKARTQDALFHGKIEFFAQAHGATRVAEIARKVHLVGFDQVTGSAPRLVAERAFASDAAEVADEDAEAGPPPEEVLASCRASFAEAMRVAILPRSRADLLAAALSEAVTNRLGSVDETFEKARAKYRPPSPPPPEPELDEEGNPIAPPAGEEGEAQEPGAGEEPGAGGGEKKDKDAFDSVWRRKCRKVLTRSIGEMLGAAAEAFERESVAEAEAEVNAELIRRVRDMRVTAAKLETLGEEDGEGDRGSETQPAADLGGEPQSPGRAEWTEYELLRRRKALLGREVDPSGASRAPTPGSRS